MLNPAYSITKFSENISEINTIKQLKTLIQGNSCLDLALKITSFPLDLSHDFGTDSLTGSGQITLLPKLYVCGELFECRPSHMLMPSSFGELEGAYLKTLKEALSTAGRSWGQWGRS